MAVITNTIRWADNTAQLRANLMQGIGTLDAMKSSVDRTVASLSGQGLFTAANKVAAAIDQMGGVTKLTASEQERANGIIDKAIEKYKTMGMVVPPALQQISDATKKSADSWGDFVSGFKVEDAITNPMGAAKTAAFALSDSIGGVALAAAGAVASITAIGGAVFSLAQKAASVGDELGDMADKTGMSVPALSRLQNAASVANTSLTQLTDAVFKIEQKMGEGGEKWDEAMKKMGLSTEALKAAGPDKYLELIAGGLATIEDPAERAAAGVAVMGKAFKDIAPVLADLPKALALTNDITPWTQEQADDAEKFEMQMKSLKVHVEALGLALGRDLIPPVSAFVGVVVDAGIWMGKLVGMMSGITPMVNRIAEAWGWAAAAIDVFRGKTDLPIKLNGAEEAARKLQELKDKATDAALAPDELVKKWKAAANGMADPINDATAAFRLQETAGKDLTRTVEDLIKAEKAAAIEGANLFGGITTINATVETSYQDLTFKVDNYREAIEDATASARDYLHNHREDLQAAADAIGNLASGGIVLNRVESDTGAILGGTVIPMFGKLPNVVAQGTNAIKEAGQEIKKSFGEKAFNALGDIAKILDNVSGKFAEVGAIAARTGQAIIKNLSTGDIFGAITAGITGVAAAFAKLFHDSEKEINPVREAFVQAAGGLDALNKKAHDAGMTLTALLNAKNPEQYKKAIDDLTAAFDRMQKAIDDGNTELSGLLSSAVTMGGTLPSTFDAAIQKLKDMGRITSDNASLFAQLTGSTSVNFKTMEDIAKKYGMDLAKLGPSFQSAKLSDTAKSVINDFDTLVRGGAAVDDVLAGLKKPINDIVNDSIKFKVAIPENMRPWVEQLMKTHQLIDENGDEITDLGKIKFAAPIETEFDKLLKKIDELIAKLTGPLTGAITGLPTVPFPVPDGYDPSNPSGLPPDAQTAHAATGGRVTRWGVMPTPQYFGFGGKVLQFHPKGTDTVPAMLTPGELVLTPPAALAYEQVMAGTGTLGAMDTTRPMSSHSGGSGDVYNVNINAVDAKSFQDLLMRNKGAVAEATHEAVRFNKNGALTKGRGVYGMTS